LVNISSPILSSKPTPAKTLSVNIYRYLLVGIGNSPFIQNELKSTKEEILWQRWIQRFMNSLREMRVEDEQKKNYKLMDALDIYVRQFAKCFEDEYFKYLKLNPLWIPDVNKHYYLKDEE
jgi:hypothetical protein